MTPRGPENGGSWGEKVALLDGQDTHGGQHETGDEGGNAPDVSPASDTWAPYYAAAAKDAADREARRRRNGDAARIAMRVLVFVAVALAAVFYKACAD
jgi:hypothetical protein